MSQSLWWAFIYHCPISLSMGCQADVCIKQEALFRCAQAHMQAQGLCPQAQSLGELIHYRLIPELLKYNRLGPFFGL